MINKTDKADMINTLACDIALAYSDYQAGLINEYAYDRIRNRALTFATTHLDSFKELKNKINELGIE